MNDYPQEFDQEQIVDLASALTKAGLVGYWREDGSLHAGTRYDEYGHLPQVGELAWDDALSEKQNIRAAARKITRERRTSLRRWTALERRLRLYKAPVPVVPTFAEFLAGLSAPDGDFKWEQDDAGDWHVYNCGERDCPVHWHTVAYTETFQRQDGKFSIEIHSGDSDGNWDFDSGFEEDEGEEAWQEFYKETFARRSDDYFRGWAEYHLDCALTGRDPCGALMGTPTAERHIAAAADNIKTLYKGRNLK